MAFPFYTQLQLHLSDVNGPVLERLPQTPKTQTQPICSHTLQYVHTQDTPVKAHHTTHRGTTVQGLSHAGTHAVELGQKSQGWLTDSQGEKKLP